MSMQRHRIDDNNPTNMSTASLIQFNQEPELNAQSSSVDGLETHGRWFTDSFGRVVLLRGVNLSGATKQPFSPYLLSHMGGPDQGQIFFNDKDISFIGRPFPLDEAAQHFARLQTFGFNVLRFLVTWEALEHQGPGQYDDAYISYVVQVLLVAKQYGFKVFIDPHQDVWSRFTGGSGAPGWTLTLAGLNIEKLHASYAALVHCQFGTKKEEHRPFPHSFPKMIWPTNYWKLGALTMFTLFFAGNVYAPLLKVNEHESIQDFLQSHFIRALQRLIQALSEADLLDSCVMGYDTLNEPSAGLIGFHDITQLSPHQELRHGVTPTPFEAMRLGSGFATRVENWEISWRGPIRSGTMLVNTENERAWHGRCIWAEHGVWNDATGQVLQPHYFHVNPMTGRVADFHQDFWCPFVMKLTLAYRQCHPRAFIFLEPAVNEPPPDWPDDDAIHSHRLVYAPHWYDGLTLLNKQFTRLFTVNYLAVKRGHVKSYLQALSFGLTGIHRNFGDQLEIIVKEGETHLPSCPILIGETGIPFDMKDASVCDDALNATLSAMDRHLLNYTIWNYCPDNTHPWGDGWNGEDLSIFTRSDQDSSNQQRRVSRSHLSSAMALNRFQQEPSHLALFKGGRGLSALLRPFASHTAGIPLYMHFDMTGLLFTFRFHNDCYSPVSGRETIIQVPIWWNLLYNCDVQVSNGTFEWEQIMPTACQRLLYRHDHTASAVHQVILKWEKKEKQSSLKTMRESCCSIL